MIESLLWLYVALGAAWVVVMLALLCGLIRAASR